MTKQLFMAEDFEKDSLAVFEKLLNGYRKAKQSGVWESEMTKLIDKLSHLPTAPFHESLIKLFDYDYLVLSENINTIIERALIIREQMKHRQRVITIKEKYYSLPFIEKNTHLKRLEILNNEGELCYEITGKLKFNTGKFLRKLIKGRIMFNEACSTEQDSKQLKELEIYYYSQFVDCSSTNPQDYYNFFTDYYGKVQFVQYFVNKEEISSMDNEITSSHIFSGVVKFTKSQQVLWAYFFFDLLVYNLELI